MEFALVFAMWTVMMVGMMTPSAMPMILMYARVGRHAEVQSTPLTATAWFVAGYFLVWVAFALLATLVQWTLERTALLDSAMASTSNLLGGLVFVAAGSYKWTRLKDVCLTQCQMPYFVESAPRAYRLKASNAAPPYSTSAGTSARRGDASTEGNPAR
jgi:predicted metal-binding membrane protein